jgi:dihydroorotase
LQTAAKSGFTTIALQPNTFPVIDNQSQVSFVQQKAQGFATSLYPIGALTKSMDGNDLAELFDMKNAGAIAFGDYGKSIENANVLKITLQYAQDFDALIVAFAEDRSLKSNGIANESEATVHFGLKGIPALAEEIQLVRNLFLLEYTGGKLHVPTISTAKSVELIRNAKAKGLKVTCSVAVHHLVLTDGLLENFDTRYKVSPPLRTSNDCKALVKGVLDNTIDCITSQHEPVDVELKKMEFNLAKNGTIGLESAFGALGTVLPTTVILEKLIAGRSIFGIQKNPIKIGKKANLTFFNPDEEWIFEKKHIFSKSKNSCFLGQKMKGKVYGSFNNNQLILNEL